MPGWLAVEWGAIVKLAKNHAVSVRAFVYFVGMLVSLLLGGMVVQGTAVAAQASPVFPSDDFAQLMAEAEDGGTVRVLVQLDTPFQPEGDLQGIQAVRSQQLGIDGLQESVLDGLAATNTEVIAAYKYIPYMALELDAAALETLASLPQVVAIEEDVASPPSLSSSVPVIGGDQAWAAGYTGAGQTVAILDTGVDTDHPAFNTGGSRIVAEGCFSTTSGTTVTTVCPGGVEESTAPGSGVDCTDAAGPTNTKAQSDCSHGTHVASIAAGDNGSTIVGVAPDANIIAVQVFSLFTSTTSCGGFSSCMLSYTSDQILALEHIYELRNTYNIASVNLSLGSGSSTEACDLDARKAAIDNLRAVGIATVIASGNSGYTNSISAPACISSAISVGATDDSDNIASFSNVASILDFLAPGVSIYAAVPGGAAIKQGTSMATPHVTGAWAVFKQAVPGASVDEAIAAFQAGAVRVDDNRSGGTVDDLARINVNNAINEYVSGLTVSVTPAKSYLLPGESTVLTIEARNDTLKTAAQVALSAVLPANLALDPTSLSADAVVVNNTITWNTGQTLDYDQSLSRTITLTVADTATAGQISFAASASSTTLDEARQAQTVLTITEVVGCGFSEGFESGVIGSAWETAVTYEGRVQVLDALAHSGSYSAILDDSVNGMAVSDAALILTADLTGQAEAVLDFSWFDLGDEYDAAYDGVFMRSQQDDAWVKVYNFEGIYHEDFQQGQVDLVAAAVANDLSVTDHFQIKFAFHDNFSFTPGNLSGGDGYALDDISLNCVPVPPPGLSAVQLIDKENPQPGDAVTFQIVVTNNEATEATNTEINFQMAEGLLLNGQVTVEQGTEISSILGGSPPLIASGLTVPGGQQIIITVPALLSENLAPGTVLQNIISLSSTEFGSPPPTVQSIVVNAAVNQVFLPLVIR
ncbi:MAG: S8 family serine peptidase [Ardenticatenaceae bacterium]|nr:S8 family serine peptidase [Ardenticatenaceae bacterium]